MGKYSGKPVLIEKELQKKFDAGKTVFVGDMRDIFSPDVPDKMLLKVFDVARRNSGTTFLFLTKNPARYLSLIKKYKLPKNIILGATIESDKNYPKISRAPPQKKRLQAMLDLANTSYDLFISIEPILDFVTPLSFASTIEFIDPIKVAVGYDNYNYKLPEPPLKKTNALIALLSGFTTVVEKTIRKAWYE